VKAEVRSARSEAGATLACFALEDEARPFRKLMAGRLDVSILVTGIGQKNAGRSVRDFLRQNSPRRVLTCGFAGGLNSQLLPGEVVFSTNDAALNDALKKSGVRAVRFVCVSHIASTAAGKQKLRATTQADAVEMESEAIRTVCGGQGIPCATVRVISDTAQEDLPLDFNLLSNPDQSLNFGKLAWAIMKSPGKIPALLRLQKNTSFAAQRLAEVLARVV